MTSPIEKYDYYLGSNISFNDGTKVDFGNGNLLEFKRIFKERGLPLTVMQPNQTVINAALYQQPGTWSSNKQKTSSEFRAIFDLP